MPDLTDILAGVRHFLESYGYLSVGVFVFLESFGMPVPAETLLVSASIVAAKGKLDIVPLAAIAAVAATLGDNVGYLIGWRFGRGFVARHGRRVGLTEKRLTKVEGFVRDYGAPFVAVARFFEVARQLNGVVAGTSGMEWRRFAVFNALGAALWVGVWSSAAYALGDHMSQVAAWAEKIGFIVVGFAVIAGAGGFWWLHRRGDASPIDGRS
jgi:membrane protein DedA with SNARE-associated domain